MTMITSKRESYLVFNKLFTSKNKRSSHRATVPVIATILLVAIAVVGSGGVFAISEEHFNSKQIGGIPQIESIEMVGYDARDVEQIKAHDGQHILSKNCCGVNDGEKNPDERIAIHFQNNSAMPVFISELRFGGEEYQYVSPKLLGNWKGAVGPQQGEYVIMTGPDGKPGGDIIQDDTPKIQAGGIVTFVLDLDRPLQNERDVQIKISTTEGNFFVSSIIIGRSIG